jgi:hypothetical protein
MLLYEIADRQCYSAREALAALRRIEEGSYGVCEISGKIVSEERLRALPATRCCLQTQLQLELESKPRPNFRIEWLVEFDAPGGDELSDYIPRPSPSLRDKHYVEAYNLWIARPCLKTLKVHI